MGSHDMHLELVFGFKSHGVIRTAKFKAKEWSIMAIYMLVSRSFRFEPGREVIASDTRAVELRVSVDGNESASVIIVCVIQTSFIIN